MTEPHTELREPHPTEHEIAGYLRRTLAAADRERVEVHLSHCAICAEELAAIVRLAPGRRPGYRWLVAGAAAAAVIAGVLLARPGTPPAGDVVRGDTTAAAVTPVLPADGAVVAGVPTLIWRSVTGAATYRVSVTGENGDSVWAAETADTTAAPPAMALPGTGRYFWIVDALLADGRSVTSGAHEFRISP